MNKKNQKIILSIISVLVIGIIVTGATFAYWKWVVDAENETELDFVVIGDNIESELYAKLDGNGITEIKNLHPSKCDGNSAILKKINISYLNKLKQSATITATLKVSEFNVKEYIPTEEQLKYLKYSLTNTESSCENDIVKNSNNEELIGNFSDLVFENKKVSNLSNNLFSQTITVPANMTVKQEVNYYLWIWLDSEYEHINIGNDNTDPMQELNFKLEWSGTIEQNSY